MGADNKIISGDYPLPQYPVYLPLSGVTTLFIFAAPMPRSLN
jgi:hypothetical protein